MANPIWITGQGLKTVNLGTVTEGTYYEVPLDAYDPAGGPVTYKFLAGTLPPGIRINSTGFIQGGPYLDTVQNQTTGFTFTVRASDQHNLISDKTFALTIANLNPPEITPRTTNLGEVFDGVFYNLQLEAVELNPKAELTWTITSGTLPNGLTLSSTGLLSGYIIPITDLGNGALQGYNNSPYEEFAYEAASRYQDNNYKFTINVFDGANYDSLTYTLKVISKSKFTAGITVITTDDTYFTVDHDSSYSPIITTPSQTLPEVRSNSKFAFKFDAIDPSNNLFQFSSSSGGAAGFDQGGTQGFDTVGFDQADLSLPPGLTLDPTTGWLSGTVSAQTQAIQTYNFQIYAYETADPTRRSASVSYTMITLGDISNNITWSTSANLGIIDNGSISELSIVAVNKSTIHGGLSYSLVSDSRLPQGLELQSSGDIVGRVAFEYFTLDGGSTTIDGKVSEFDNLYSFTVQATTSDGTASSQQTFTVLVNNYNKTPYENIYLKALPSQDQRSTFLSIVNNKDIFPDALIYRPTDPNFGRAKDMRSLFIPGLSPTDVTTYAAAMATNTYNKRINFGAIKTAQAVDSNLNVKYEVVYVELNDSATYKGNSPANSTYDTIIGKTVYPNSFANMTSVIANAARYANQGALPAWMTSPQANKSTLGFTRALVLAYTVPDASNLIAYRLSTSGLELNNINFVIDRYDLDNYLSSNFNTTTDSFIGGVETTFDRIQRVGTVTTSATYGTVLAFNMINNQTVSQINSKGGIDGITDFKNGDTLIFVKQENYAGETALYDGWFDNGIIPGWYEFIHSASIANGTSLFPTNPVVGQVAHINNVYYMFTSDNVWKIANLRAGIWTINIDNSNNVTLTPATFLRISGHGVSDVQYISSIQAGDQVQIVKGNNYSDSVVTYSAILLPGNSVPTYIQVTDMLSAPNDVTRFDAYGTRFINNRTIYQDPESKDTWLKFPYNGPLQ
jgi:hypothetical protein